MPAALAEWLPLLLVACAGLALAEVVFRVGERLVRRATRSAVVANAVATAVRAPAHALLALLALNIVWQQAPDDLPRLASVERVTGLLLIAVLTWLLTRAVQGLEHGVVAANPVSVADNLEARRIQTQSRVLSRVVQGLVVLIGAAWAMMSFPAVRQVGASLLASAGVVGIVAGFAARPVLGNLIAGLQIGLSQPIRIDDVVVVENEWGVIEDITGTYVVVRIWDERRLIVPLQYWIEKPFQNWTRSSSELIGTVVLWVDYRMPLQPLRDELQRVCQASPHWDQRLALLQVTEADKQAMQLRCLVTSASASAGWDLRCEVREALIQFIQREHAHCLPRQRGDFRLERHGAAEAGPSGPASEPATVAVAGGASQLQPK